MKRADLEFLIKDVRKEYSRREQLGGYSTDAEAILLLYRVIYNLLNHQLEKMPRPKTDDKA